MHFSGSDHFHLHSSPFLPFLFLCFFLHMPSLHFLLPYVPHSHFIFFPHPSYISFRPPSLFHFSPFPAAFSFPCFHHFVIPSAPSFPSFCSPCAFLHFSSFTSFCLCFPTPILTFPFPFLTSEPRIQRHESA